MTKKLENIGITITIIATIAIWVAVGTISEITGDYIIRNFAAILAFVFTLIAWLMLISSSSHPQSAKL